MSENKDVMLIGGVVIASVVALTLMGGRIKSFFKILGLKKEVEQLEETIDEVKEDRSEQYAGLQDFYEDAVDTINDLNRKLADANAKILNDPAVVTISDGIRNLESTIPAAVERSMAANETINKIISDAGGVVSSGTAAGDKIVEEVRKIVAWTAPGWMPKGEV